MRFGGQTPATLLSKNMFEFIVKPGGMMNLQKC